MNISLSNNSLSLREFRYDDWKSVHEYASQEIVSQYQAWGPNNETDSKMFVEKVIKDSRKTPRVRFAFAVIFEDKLIGTAEISIRNFNHRNGEISYIINPNFWGRGFATDIAYLLIDFGFEHLALHRIYATCNPRNIASTRVMEKVGMKKEGIMRECLLIKDGWRDSLLFSVLEYEWNLS